MSARTEVERHVGQGRQRPATGAMQSQDGTQLDEPTTAVTDARRSAAADEPRLSVDPMHATDRYRLVIPYSLRV